MELTVERTGEWAEVRMSGRLDAAHAAQAERELGEIVRDGNHCIRLYMAGVEYVSSAGIRVLVTYYRDLKRLGGALHIAEASSAVRTVIELTGLAAMFEAPAAHATEAVAAAPTVCGALSCTPFPTPSAPPMRCALLGKPENIGAGGYGPEDLHEVASPRGTMALGLGAFGDSFSDCRGRFGEFLCAGGVAACLPSDGAKTFDYVIERGAMSPKVRALVAIVCQGAFGIHARFEHLPGVHAAPMSDLAEAALALTGTSTAALVAVAETAGLIGAALRHSPASIGEISDRLDFPEVRKWFTFTPERAFDRGVVLLAGIAARTPEGRLRAFVRPLGEGKPFGHFHAAAFSYRALSKGPLVLEDTAAALFEEQSPLGLLHLLNDNRALTGAGESLFLRGALWAGAIGPVTGEGDAQ